MGLIDIYKVGIYILLIMKKEEIRSKLTLTQEQRELVDKLNAILKEMKEKNVGLLFDGSVEALSFVAYNKTEVLEITDGYDIDEDKFVNVEDLLEWRNVLSDIDYADSYYNGIWAKLGERSTKAADD